MYEAEDGFLSETVNNIIDSVRTKYSEYCSLLHRANRLAVSHQHAIIIHDDSIVERYAACLFARILATTQSGVLLLERGLVPQSRMLLRSALETLFTLGAIAEDRGVIDRLIENHAVEQKRVADSWKRLKHPELKQIIEAEGASIDLQTFLNSPANRLSTFDLAQKADLEDWYRTVYMDFSWSVHGAAIDLDRHVVVGPDGKVWEFRNEAEIDGQEATWLCCIEIILKSLTFLGKIFANVDQTLIEQLYGDAHALYRKSLD